MDAEDYINILEESGIFETIPRPSYYISSGGGIYAQFLLYNVSNNPKMESLYRKLKNKLYEVLNGDERSRELNHLYRIPGLINHNRGTRSYIVDFDNLISTNPKRWYISELSNEVFEYTREDYRELCKKRYKNRGIEMKEQREKEQLKRKKKKYSLHLAPDQSKNQAHASAFYRTSKLRISDISNLINMRISKKENLDNMRNEILMIYALSLYYTNFDLKGISESVHHYIEKEVYKLNRKFGSQALKEERPKSISKSAKMACEKLIEAKGIKEFNEGNHDGIYYYNTDTIIKRLNITVEEMQFMDHLAYKEIREQKVDERKRLKASQAIRNEFGNTKREQSKIDNNAKVIKLLEKRYKQTQIVKQTGLSKAYVSKIVKDINKLKL